NHFNAFPIKIFEYMAAGLAIICSNFPIYKEIVEDNNCGICVDPEKVEDISKVADYLMANPDIIRTMGENGQKAVKEKYNWASQEAILLDFYKKLER
ncbi:MAG: glycosyltransferase, partial [Clostridia bacterium]